MELLRQWMDHEGWYDRKELTLRRLVDMQFVAAMGPPGGGRNSVTNRYIRHFSIISVTAFDHDNLSTIFCALLDWWLSKSNYGANITRMSKSLVSASLEIYSSAQTKLLPTPTKSHYTYNLRDVSKVIQGMTKAGSSVGDPSMMVRLWMHECLRVFYDRLVNDNDRLILCQSMSDVLSKDLKENMAKILGLNSTSDDAMLHGVRNVTFGDYMLPGYSPFSEQL